MVKMTKKIFMRPAIAMIELIFAMVIMGIVLMSAPQILSVSAQSTNVATQQEAIAAASSQISLILTHHWDESDSNATTGYGILTVASQGLRNVNNFNMTRRYNINPGFQGASTVLGIDGFETGLLDDIDDFNNQTYTLALYANENASFTNNEGDYIDSAGIRLQTTISYGNDTSNYFANAVVLNNPFSASASASSNIKIITVLLDSNGTSADLNKSISLYAFSCNVGTPAPGVVAFP
jgi:hypothetical protein